MRALGFAKLNTQEIDRITLVKHINIKTNVGPRQIAK